MAKRASKKAAPAWSAYAAPAWSAYEALRDCERRLGEATAARDKAESEVARLRGVIDSHEREAEARHADRARAAIDAAASDYQDLKHTVREFVEAFEELHKVKR